MNSEPSFTNPNGDMQGRMLLGRYRIMRELAKGGMGVVYLARAEGAIGFVKPVVVKLILPDLCDNADFVGMFAREAQILSHLRDPGIVDVIEFGQDGDAYVMVLEYVRGYHLGQWQKYLTIKRRMVPTDVAILLTIDVLDALEHAHGATHPDGTSMAIVHRDISPSNIMLDSAGRARLLDFGVARMRGGEQMYKTQVQGFRGKLSYSAPELFAGVDASPCSDIYACGVVFHEMLLGRNTFRGSNQSATFHNVLTKRPESVHTVRDDAPDGLDAVVEKSLAKDPANRYQSAAEFASALRDLLPTTERQVRKEVTALWALDFDADMASVLGVESLTVRDELWRRISNRPADAHTPTSESGTGLKSEHTRVARNTRNTRKSANLRTPSGSGAAYRPQVPPIPPRPTVPQNAGALSQGKLLLGIAALVLVAVVAVVVGLGFVLRQPATAPAPVQVFATPAAGVAPEVGQQPSSQPIPGEVVAVAGDKATDLQQPEKQPVEVRSRPRPKTQRSGPDAAALTRAFRAKHQAIQSCFVKHAETVQGSPQVEVEFEIDAGGRLQRAQLHPPNIRGTALGQCILTAAKQARFPAQGEGLTFSIPVTAKRVP